MLSISLRVMLETMTPAWIRKNHLNHGLKENMLWSVSYVVITHSMWLRSICILIDYRIYSWILAGFGFSRPKPVFPVQNGIIWDKHFSRPKLGKTVPNWEKVCSTIFQAVKSFKKCDVSKKDLTGHWGSFHKYCSDDLWAHNPNLRNLNFCHNSCSEYIIGSDLYS